MPSPQELKPLPQSSSVVHQHATLIAVLVIIITLLAAWLLPILLNPNNPSTTDNASDSRLVTNSITNTPTTSISAPPSVSSEPDIPESSLSNAEQALQRQLAQQLLAKALQQNQQLQQAKATDWAKGNMQQLSDRLAGGDQAYSQQLFKQAVNDYQQAVDIGTKLIEQLPEQLKYFLQLGYEALDTGQQEPALDAFDIAKSIDSTDQQAIEGYLRAQVLEQVFEQYSLGQAELSALEGNLITAREYFQKALAIDPKFTKASAALTAVQKEIEQQQLQSTLSKAYSALLEKRYPSAIYLFNKALSIVPNHPAAVQGLSQSEAEQFTASTSQKLVRAQQAEHNEQWDLALSLYNQLLAGNNQHQQAKFGQLRSKARWQLHQQLENFNRQPLQLTLKKQYDLAQNAYAEALLILENETNAASSGDSSNSDSSISSGSTKNPSPTLEKQVKLLKSQLQWSQTKRPLTLQSDGLTQVQIQAYGSPVQKLGPFSSKTLMLKPGRYTITGIRQGFRDDRQSLVIANQANLMATVICSESIR